MSEKNIENLIKEILKDIASNLYDLNYEDSMSILAEYREWILFESYHDDILMLPYEAYTDWIDRNTKEDLN